MVTEKEPAARLAAIRESLPHQRGQKAVGEAALQFGLPMTGQEIHRRIVATVPRWRAYGVFAIWAIVCFSLGGLMFGYTMSYDFKECRLAEPRPSGWPGASIRDCEFGTVMGRAVGGMLLAMGTGLILAGPPAWTTVWRAIDDFDGAIPDQALLRYDEAKSSGLFSVVYVVEPAPRSQARVLQDPWLVGSLIERGAPMPRADTRRAYIVLAYWE